MPQTIDLRLDRRWIVRVTWSPQRLLRDGHIEKWVLDSDSQLQSQLLTLATDPWVENIHCERYFGTLPARRYRVVDS